MKKSQAVFIAGIIISMSIGACYGSGYPPIVTNKPLYATHDFRNKKAPKIEVQKWLTGRLPILKGKVVIVDFWATWCPPCRATIPELGKWQKEFKKNLVVIGISNEKSEVVRKFMKTHPMPYNVGIDHSDKMSNEIGVKGIPHVLVISADGIVRWQGFPLDQRDPLTEAKIREIIDASNNQRK